MRTYTSKNNEEVGELIKGSLKKKKRCKFGEKGKHFYDKCLPQSWPHLTQKYGSAKDYYKRPYTEVEKKHGRLTFLRCIHCGKLKIGLEKEGELTKLTHEIYKGNKGV